MYARHAAWLSATPEKAKESRAASFRKQREDHPALIMPDVFVAAHLLEILNDVGPLKSNGMSADAIRHGDIVDWETLNRHTLSIWEARTVLKMSSEYAIMYHEARKPTCAAPFTPLVVPTRDSRQNVVAGFKQLVAELRAAKAAKAKKTGGKGAVVVSKPTKKARNG